MNTTPKFNTRGGKRPGAGRPAVDRLAHIEAALRKLLVQIQQARAALEKPAH